MKGTNRSLISLFCLAIGLSLSACGIESVLYLNPPQFVTFATVGSTFTFRKILDNSEFEFRGFELYYKFYDDSNRVEDNISSRDDLLVKKFHRITSNLDKKDSISRPLFPIPLIDRAGTEFDITVDFSNTTAASDDPSLSQSISVTLRRGVEYITAPDIDYFKRFELDAFELADYDMTTEVYNTIINTSGPPVHLALYALSYGKKDLIFDVYSVAVFLGDIEITF